MVIIMSIRIIADSASDITQEEARKLDLEILPIKVVFGDEEYLDGITLNHRQFFEKLIETDVMPTTCQITAYEFEQVFQKVKDAGDEAVCITLSTKVSGTYQSACIAAENFRDCVSVVDSENVCIGERLLILRAIEMRDRGLSREEIAAALEREKKEIRLIALLDTLEYLKRGGRISPTVAFAGEMLSIKPVISVQDGEVVLLGRARGSKNGNNRLIEFVDREGIDFSRPFCLAYSGLSDVLLKKYIADSEHLYRGKAEDLPVSSIGCTIGTHTGPGAVAVAFFRANKK
jgi:DegV family protein with EDD domain